MVFKRLFNITKAARNKEGTGDALDYNVTNLKKGYILDYDLKTWEVSACYEYDWGDGYYTHEYKLDAGGKALFLHVEVDDEIECSISTKIKVQSLASGIIDQIMDNDEPPRELVFEGKKYIRTEESLGHFRNLDGSNREKFVSWTFEDEKGEEFVNIERWGEEEFEAAKGHYIETYEISNILPK